MQIVIGDILKADADVIVHQVNCQGVMGKGLAKQIKDEYPEVFSVYSSACTRENTKHLLGYVQFVKVGFTRTIANLFAQERYGSPTKCHTDYDALRQCLITVNAQFKGKTVAVPYKLGCGLAGGDWEIVSKIIEETLTDCDVKIYKFK